MWDRTGGGFLAGSGRRSGRSQRVRPQLQLGHMQDLCGLASLWPHRVHQSIGIRVVEDEFVFMRFSLIGNDS
ncbi:hypothetical protein ADK67_05475 [Saccharothrix sp. NRRL B-16348]|nr:hypothetical protein ADK67_05475 [Saccharothrix sp. NRRL B-16348]